MRRLDMAGTTLCRHIWFYPNELMMMMMMMIGIHQVSESKLPHINTFVVCHVFKKNPIDGNREESWGKDATLCHA